MVKRCHFEFCETNLKGYFMGMQILIMVLLCLPLVISAVTLLVNGSVGSGAIILIGLLVPAVLTWFVLQCIVQKENVCFIYVCLVFNICIFVGCVIGLIGLISGAMNESLKNYFEKERGLGLSREAFISIYGILAIVLVFNTTALWRIKRHHELEHYRHQYEKAHPVTSENP